MARKKGKKRGKLTLSKINKKVNSLLSTVESKDMVTSYESDNITTTPTSYNFDIPLIPQGTGESDRIGEKINLTKLQAKIQLQIGDNAVSSLNDNYNQMRLILILYQTQSSTGDVPTMDDILEVSSITGYPQLVMNSLYKKNPKFKYRKLYDKVHNLYWRNSSGATGGAPQIKQISITRKLNHEIHFAGVSLPTGWVPLLLVASDSAAIQHPLFSMNARISFTDL